MEPRESGPNGTGRRILLVEDSYTNRRIAARMLERLGYEADLAENGLEALSALSHGSYDAILMDIMMPEMDGLECTRQIRQRFPEPWVPIIAVTANAMQGDRERCLQAGADDYLSKPFRREQLSWVLERIIGSSPTARSGGGEPAPGDGILDMARLEEIGLTGPDADPELAVAHLFRKEARAARADIREALDRSDGERLRRAAHQLKGGAANVGATALSVQAQELEQCGRDGDLTLASALASSLFDECERVIAALEALESRRSAV